MLKVVEFKKKYPQHLLIQVFIGTRTANQQSSDEQRVFSSQKLMLCILISRKTIKVKCDLMKTFMKSTPIYKKLSRSFIRMEA